MNSRRPSTPETGLENLPASTYVAAEIEPMISGIVSYTENLVERSFIERNESERPGDCFTLSAVELHILRTFVTGDGFINKHDHFRLLTGLHPADWGSDSLGALHDEAWTRFVDALELEERFVPFGGL